MGRYGPGLIPKARELRQTATRAEEIVWQFLRRKRVAGLKWRRQQPVGPFIVDFYCPDLKLVIELDGAAHENREDSDRARQSYLEEHGLTVLRFFNGDVYQRKEGVFNLIRQTCLSMSGRDRDE